MAGLAYASAAYYRHSGRCPLSGTLRMLVLGALAAIIAGTLYAYIDLYIPIGGWVTFMLTLGAGYLVGQVLKRGVQRGKVRNEPVVVGVAILTGLLLVAVSWEMYVYALLQRGGQAAVPLSAIVGHPAVLLEVIKAINAHGAWTISGTTPTGPVLALIWLIEAGILIGTPLTIARRAVNAAPFCEQCDRWCGSRTLASMVPSSPQELRTKLEQKQFDTLSASGQAAVGASSFFHVYLQGCATCDTTQTLCVDAVTTSVDRNGRRKTTSKPVVRRLRLSPEETVAVATSIASLQASAG